MEKFTGNKNDRQINFNKIKGVITELNEGEKFCSVTLSVGHEVKRFVNLILKKDTFPYVQESFPIGSKVLVKYYITSRNKMGKWKTMANVIDMELSSQNTHQNTSAEELGDTW